MPTTIWARQTWLIELLQHKPSQKSLTVYRSTISAYVRSVELWCTKVTAATWAISTIAPTVASAMISPQKSGPSNARKNPSPIGPIGLNITICTKLPIRRFEVHQIVFKKNCYYIKKYLYFCRIKYVNQKVELNFMEKFEPRNYQIK